MRSVRRSYESISDKNPGLSSFVCFGRAVRGRQYTRRCIRRWFTELVDKEDYSADNTNALVRQMWELSNKVEEDYFETKFRQGKEFGATAGE